MSLTVTEHLQAALDELDSEASSLQDRLGEIYRQRQGIAALLHPSNQPAAPVEPERRLAAVPTLPKQPAGSKYDLAQVAAIAAAAHLAGSSMADAVVAELGLNPAMGSYLIARARKAGHKIPTGHPLKPKTKTAASKGRPRSQDRARLPDLVAEARTLGVSVQAHVADALRISPSAAKSLIGRARNEGLIGDGPAVAMPKMSRSPFDPDRARAAAVEGMYPGTELS